MGVRGKRNPWKAGRGRLEKGRDTDPGSYLVPHSRMCVNLRRRSGLEGSGGDFLDGMYRIDRMGGSASSGWMGGNAGARRARLSRRGAGRGEGEEWAGTEAGGVQVKVKE